MKLSGKALEDFEEWLEQTHLTRNAQVIKSGLTHDSMKWGVYVDFFDEKGGIDVLCRFKDKRYLSWAAPHVKDDVYLVDEHKTRSQARKAAIEKANEIYNAQ